MVFTEADVFSSPDPLNDSLSTPYTRRVTRSIASSQRQLSAAGTTPRRRTFQLEVGDQESPQKLLVTVEAESRDNVARRLFTSPTKTPASRRRGRPKTTTTTTTVPLKGLSDDEGPSATTPKRRGRPPKSGTPKPGGTASRRKGTPIRKTPANARRTGLIDMSTEMSDPSIDSILSGSAQPPASNRRSKRKVQVATSDIDMDIEDVAPAQEPLPKRRTRARRKSLVPQDFMILPDNDSSMEQSGPPASSRNTPAPSEDSRRVSAGQKRAPLVDLVNVSQLLPETDDDTDAGTTRGTPAPKKRVAKGSNSPTRDDQDTIFAAEEFTMISMDSMQSMRALQQSGGEASNLPDMGDETSLIINRTLESLRNGHAEEPVDDGGNMTLSPPEILPMRTTPAGSPERTPRPSEHSIQPPAAQSPSTPVRSPRKAKATPLRQQLLIAQAAAHGSPAVMKSPAVAEVTEAPASVLKESERRISAVSIVDPDGYDDSFSEIPDAVLEAATPRRPLTIQQAAALDADEDDTPTKTSNVGSVGPAVPTTDSNRLPTPEETPSPEESEVRTDPPKQSYSDSALPSSPPVEHIVSMAQPDDVNMTPGAGSTETPPTMAAVTSTQLPPPAPIQEAHARLRLSPRLAGRPQRPALSPIVRAGQPLQSIMSDNSSPRSGRSSLGSPFQSRRSSDATQRDSPPKRAERPRTPEHTGPFNLWAHAFGSSMRTAAVTKDVPAIATFSAAGLDDPFGPASGISGRNPTGDHASGSQSGPEVMAPGLSGTNNTRDSSPPGDEMSWMPDTGLRIDEQPFPGVPEAGPAEPASPKPSLAGKETLSQEDAQADEEEDIWQIEAQRRSVRPQPQQQERQGFFGFLRSKISSPWRSAGDETPDKAATPPRAVVAGARPEETGSEVDDEYSVVAERLGTKKADRAVQPVNSARPARVDLSAFFSSPAAFSTLPSLPFKPFGAPLVPPAGAKTTDPPSENAPQTKQSAEPSTEPQREPSPAAPSVSPSLKQASPANTENDNDRTNELASSNGPAEAAAFSPVARSNSPATPEQLKFTPIPQKMNFTPRLRQAGSSLFEANSLFTPRHDKPAPVQELRPGAVGGAAAGEGENSPQKQHGRDESSSLTQSGDIYGPPLRPLPPRILSPTKSCFRSPLKPSTPGRVVAFASSTRSQPAADGPAPGAAQQAAVPTFGLPTATTAPAHDANVRGAFRRTQPFLAAGRARTPLSFSGPPSSANTVSKTPATAAEAPQQPLSSTQWTKAHWIRLDQLLQQRRKGKLPPPTSTRRSPRQASMFGTGGHLPPATPATPSPGAGGVMALLGKDVAAQGERMTLERWHLEIVDAFRAEVGYGFDDRELAKRLFALIVGEQRRRHKRSVRMAAIRAGEM